MMMQKSDVFDMIEKTANAAGIECPGVDFNLKGRTAGTFMWDEYFIQINPLVMSDFPQHMPHLVVHEMAHALDYKRYGHRKNARGQYAHHDSIFRGLMMEIATNLGIKQIDTSSTHQLPLPKSRKMRRWQYTCGCNKPHIVSTIIHNRVQKKGQRRICNTCKVSFGKTDFLKEQK